MSCMYLLRRSGNNKKEHHPHTRRFPCHSIRLHSYETNRSFLSENLLSSSENLSASNMPVYGTMYEPYQVNILQIPSRLFLRLTAMHRKSCSAASSTDPAMFPFLKASWHGIRYSRMSTPVFRS